MARQAKAKVQAPIHPEVEALRSYLEGVAKKVSHDLFGPNGPPWGTTMTHLEELALQTRAIFTEEFLSLSLKHQAAMAPQERPPAFQTCPTCQKPLDESPGEPEPRTVATRAGAAAWSEPQEYCTRCRRAFFPSGQKSRP